MAVVGSVFLLTQLVAFRYGRDQGIYATIAQVIRDGGVPYRDAWDFKPPGIFFVYTAASLFLGNSAHAIRYLESAALLSLFIAFARISRLYVGHRLPGIFGAALAIFGHVQLGYWHTGQPESFGAVSVAWAIAFAAGAMESSGTDQHAAMAWLASGVCSGLGVLLKPQIGAAGLASLAVGCVDRVRNRPSHSLWRNLLPVLGPFCLGAAVVLTLGTSLFVVRGGGAELFAALFVFVPRYVALAGRERASRPC